VKSATGGQWAARSSLNIGQSMHQGIIADMARFIRRFARLMTDVFFAAFLRFVATRVGLRFFADDFRAAFFLLAIWSSPGFQE
jgi:hypothetical protein